jgi:hypothetical protein
VRSFLHEVEPRFAVSRTLSATVDTVWRLIVDTQMWNQWGPSVRNVQCRDRFIRKGSLGRIQTPLRIWVPFVVDRFEPFSYWDWRVGGIPATGHRVEPEGCRRCRLSFSFPPWAAPYAFVCQLALKRIDRLLSV